MATLEASFEADLRDAALDEVETEADAIGAWMLDTAEDYWRAYASANEYDIDLIWADAAVDDITRGRRAVTVRATWPFSGLFEFGVEPHVITGNPTLSFSWPSPPEGTRPPGAPSYVVADEVNWGSVTGGIDEARAIRDMLADLRRLFR
jgi:hypothetical protein